MSNETEQVQLLEGAREGIAHVADVLLPGTQNLPSGRDVGVHLEWLDRVLSADPRLFDVVVTVGLRAAVGDTCTLADVEESAGDRLEDLVFALNSAYYMSPQVHAALGYPGQRRRPISQATAEELCSEELLAPVRDRGPTYVPTPS
ncbi:hypothetical protein JCM18899A_53280 [Nocardioides sp. AN3]